MKKTQLARVLQERGTSIKELADAIGVSVRTIHNISCGSSKSLIARRKISNILRTKIWPDVEVTERVVTFMPGLEIEWPTAAKAREFAQELGSAAVRRGVTVGFTKPCSVTIEVDKPKRSAKSQNRKISGGSSE
jgi:transcriptional regulator with XRE-family HTH domain